MLRRRSLALALALGATLVSVASAFSFAACGGGVISLAGDQPSDGDGGIPGFGTVDPAAVSAVKLTCPEGAEPANICCKFDPDGGLVCGQWTATPLKACPVDYAKYQDPVLCCTAAGCEPGTPDDAGDSGMLHVVPTSSCPVACDAGWPTPDGKGCCQASASGEGATCSEGSFPPVYEYPVAATFDTDGSVGPLACPGGSTPSSDGLGCCQVNSASFEVCGEFVDAGSTPVTLGLPGSCADDGVCCGPNAAVTPDRLGCCTVDSQDFALCIHFVDPARYDGGALPGAPFYGGSLVPFPWGPAATSGGCSSP